MSQNPILSLLFENKMAEALKNMRVAYPNNDNIINFSARCHSLKNQQDDGILTQEAADVREARIRAAMTNFLNNNEIENPDFELIYEPKARPTASPKNFDQWDLLSKTAKNIYKGGLEQNNIWERAGGDLATQQLNLQANSQWYNAIKALKLGGGGKDISAKRLVEAMLEDYPSNPDLKQLMESFL